MALENNCHTLSPDFLCMQWVSDPDSHVQAKRQPLEIGLIKNFKSNHQAPATKLDQSNLKSFSKKICLDFEMLKSKNTRLNKIKKIASLGYCDKQILRVYSCRNEIKKKRNRMISLFMVFAQNYNSMHISLWKYKQGLLHILVYTFL